jgi:hypothetical protein
VLPSDSADVIIIRRKHAARTTTAPTPPARALNNCEKLNRDNAEATDRRDQLRGPSELTTRDELLRKAETDIARAQQLAAASNCKLKP